MDNVELIQKLNDFTGSFEELYDILQYFDLKPKQVGQIIYEFAIDLCALENMTINEWLLYVINSVLNEQ